MRGRARGEGPGPGGSRGATCIEEQAPSSTRGEQVWFVDSPGRSAGRDVTADCCRLWEERREGCGGEVVTGVRSIWCCVFSY